MSQSITIGTQSGDRPLFAQTAWENGEQIAVAIDGTVMRGAWVDEKTQVKLLAAMIHGRGLVVGQIRVPDDTTKDIVKHGMDYVMTVKGNRPTLKSRRSTGSFHFSRNQPTTRSRNVDTAGSKTGRPGPRKPKVLSSHMSTMRPSSSETSSTSPELASLANMPSSSPAQRARTPQRPTSTPTSAANGASKTKSTTPATPPGVRTTIRPTPGTPTTPSRASGT